MSENKKIIQPSGILNATVGKQIRSDINDCIATGINIILIDLQQVNFVDSSGLGALISAMKFVESSDGQIFLCSVNDQVKMLLEITKTEKLFNFFANQEEFKKVFFSIESTIQVINYSIDFLSPQKDSQMATNITDTY